MSLDGVASPRPLLSVVIPVRNGASTLAQQLHALANQHSAPAFEIIVSDNGSEDDLDVVLRAAAKEWPWMQLRYVDSSEKRGVSHARNVGARAALAPNIAFCDSDDIVCADWVRVIAEGLQRSEGVGGALDESSLNGACTRHLARTDGSLPVGLNFLPYAIGANCGVRRCVWEYLNGFDEDFLHGAEEVDFYWRLQLAGYRLDFLPTAIVAYRHPDGLWNTARRAYRYGQGSCQLAAVHRDRLPKETWLEAAKTWSTLLIRLPLIAAPTQRLHYVRRLAHSVGQVVGSRRFGVMHLA